MNRATELEIVRRAYAKQIMAAAEVRDHRLEAAFASVPREKFLGDGPWQVFRWGRGYVATPSDDPLYLYDDVLVGIIPERNLNNGQPSLHAALIGSAAPRAEEHVVHIGAGVGYYTAILHHLVGPTGQVTAIEYDHDLAAQLKTNFAAAHNVVVVHGDGSKASFDPADVIYISAGATRPTESWLDGLRDGGRLILPLTATKFPAGDIRRGAVFLIERRGDEFLARWISPVAIFPCEGSRDPASERALAAAFDKGGAARVTRLQRRGGLPEEQCWLRTSDWCLTYD